VEACIGFIGELKKTYTILDRKLKVTGTPIHRYIIIVSLFFFKQKLMLKYNVAYW